MQQGTKVKTNYGTTETVLSVTGNTVVTYESAVDGYWWHVGHLTVID